MMSVLSPRKMRNLYGVVLFIIGCIFGEHVITVSARDCAANSPLVGLSSDLAMVQHQLRGSILFIDDCTFQVTRFDMIPGIDVYWWGSLGDGFDNMTSGFAISQNKLNETYQNVTLEVTLDSNYTWDDFRLLSVWDKYTGSDFGHVFLEVLRQEAPPLQSGDGVGSPAPAPGPDVGWGPEASPPLSANEPTAPTTPSVEIIGHLQPTMFENCVCLNNEFRLRWTVNWDLQTVDLGLEGALSKSQYMAFGWAKPGVTTGVMLQSDVVVAGIDEKDIPYAEDYYLGGYSECNWDTSSPSGVCPDYVYAGGLENDSNTLIYGRQIDGITLIRYQRPLLSADLLYDVSINTSDSMQVVWAMGMMKPPDVTKGNRTPQNHGPNFAHKTLILGDTIDDCLGPMVSHNGYLGEVVVADRGTTLVVTADAAAHYPDPPFPEKVFYINQKEAPLLKVERGVPVTFSVQAGHGFALYITDSPVGGASNSNSSQIIYAGGPEAHGVPVLPYALTWNPNRGTPDLVYYQDYFVQKRGWKVQVVDGGLSDMYNQSATLADSKVTVFWTVSGGQIYLAVRGEVKSGYLAIAFGSGMINAFSYVGWVDEQEVPHINAYWMDGKKASSIHATEEELTDQKCERVDGRITFEFSRALQPSCNKGTLCKNVIDPSSVLKVVWAMGDAWTADTLADSNMHTDISTKPTLIQLLSGAAKVEQLQPVLAVHGFMMFIAWGMLLPGGVLGARYLKHLNNNGWFEIHMYSQLSALVVMLLGLLFAVGELHGFYFRTAHMKVGLFSILLALLQAVNGYLRPKNAAPGESKRPQRVVWQYIHMYSGRSALVLGFLSSVTGISQLARRDGVEHMKGLQWALFAWFLAAAAVVGYIEVQGFWSKKGHDTVAFDRILGSEDDSQDQLAESHGPFFPGSQEMQASTARGTEIQLEALH